VLDQARAMLVGGKPGLTSTVMENRSAWPIVSVVISGTMVIERPVATGKALVGPGDAFGPGIGVGADGPPQPQDIDTNAEQIGSGQHLARV
jgi:hypothetical protein